MKLLKFIFPIISILLLFSNTKEKIPSSKLSNEAIIKHTKRITEEFKNKGLTFGNPIFMRIFKESNELEVWVQNGTKFSKFKTYPICYYSGELGPKTKQGDGQAPEGFYFIMPYQLNPYSNYHLSINLGYPNKYDREHNYTGNYLMIHGSCVSIGCYAMTDEIIEEIWTIMAKSFENEQPFFRVHIFPFKLTNEKLSNYLNHKNYSF